MFCEFHFSPNDPGALTGILKDLKYSELAVNLFSKRPHLFCTDSDLFEGDTRSYSNY